LYGNGREGTGGREIAKGEIHDRESHENITSRMTTRRRDEEVWERHTMERVNRWGRSEGMPRGENSRKMRMD
jgi:hypothetical protein